MNKYSSDYDPGFLLSCMRDVVIITWC